MTQFRADEGLAFMLQYENVAWYDAGEVRILDRRIYPAKIEFVRCKTHVEVMQAIRDMVTQSAGPYTAAAMGMALAAYECREKPAEEQLRFLQAADAICLDGYVVNKVGTLQIAICANHFGIPTFVTGAPDIGHETKDTVKIEMRDPEFTLQAMGVRTAAQGVKGYYPAFDMTPPHLISGIVTDRGVFSPFDLHRYFAGGGAGEYDTVV